MHHSGDVDREAICVYVYRYVSSHGHACTCMHAHTQTEGIWEFCVLYSQFCFTIVKTKIYLIEDKEEVQGRICSNKPSQHCRDY